MAYSVGILSRYMQSPMESHDTTIEHVLRYLQGTKAHGIMYERTRQKTLVGYSDSSYNTILDDGKSTIENIFYYGSSPITWCSQKQDIVSLSSCEAEYMAANVGACQAIWLQDLMSEIVKNK